ncbi:SDR family NAD(P)-dependent oxidoreductase [Galbitalea soli]|uniref:SDR family NAD(P)-dependent oxidoreductase n=1 Tax=Galbitalea soli TaxID=1268042 RepID=A0A7C9TSI7_9MICO|nr:SDR family NAD(P)-dependent oxidoreductase [Galbitalea soli]NEM91904.1 SDR family NAD(P)-dependent oxidoreductase [Galbitalea soli]NYJ29259.1 NAD(P)-dependent dehydrogenase (short-subunit alcohol dehydrogenase family) [Galbitalea soli]
MSSIDARGWDPVILPTQAGTTIVVTGGTAGIGYFAAEQLARAGARIILAARSEHRADLAAASIRARVRAADIEYVNLELSSLESILDAGKHLTGLGPIDVLINNAGLTSGSATRQTTEDGLELIVGTNAFGHFALTALLAPALSEDARVVWVGSLATRLTRVRVDDLQQSHGDYSFSKAYAYSKHAVHGYAFELDRRLRAAGSSRSSLLAHPGFALDGLSLFRPGITDRVTPRRAAGERLLRLVAQGKDRGAWPIVRAAADPSAQGGQFFGPRGRVKGEPVLVEPVADSAAPEFGAELWRQSEAATGIHFAV